MNADEVRALLETPVMPPEVWRDTLAWLNAHHSPEHTAYHEAGHAVVAHVLGATIRAVSIERRDRALGQCLAELPPSRYAGWRQVVVAWAGPAAEGRGAGSSLDTDIIAIVPLVAELVRDRRRRQDYSDRARQRAEILVARHWPAVEKLARGLLRQKAIPGDLVHGIIAHALAAAGRRPRPAGRHAGFAQLHL